MKKTVAIIGAGEIGRALARILEANRNVRVALWDKDPKKVSDQRPLDQIVSGADFLFLCITSWAVRDALNAVRAHLPKTTIVVSLAKGIERTTQKTMDALLKELLPPEQPRALLSGPMLAEELMRGMPGFAVVATDQRDAYGALDAIFKNTILRIEYSSDMRSVALVSILKNIYAIALGVADGLKWGGNQKGWLVVAAFKEMADSMSMLGGNKKMLYTVAGLGDLLATGYSSYSRNHQVGHELITTGQCCLESEGFISLPSLWSMLEGKTSALPILTALAGVIMHNQDAKATFRQFETQE
jgi:glycerol-3-phosphate dehydrogenase (NAD(P)+)